MHWYTLFLTILLTLSTFLRCGALIDKATAQKINPQWCDQGRILVAVLSAAENTERRAAIRETWGQQFKSAGHHVFFIIGHSSGTLAEENEAEQAYNNDLFFVDTHESFKSLTYKTAAFVKAISFFSRTVGRSSYTLKTDDDTYIHMEALERRLLEICTKRNRIRFARQLFFGNKIASGYHAHFLLGYIESNRGPVRDQQNKYFVPVEQYGADKYPTYPQGSMYIADTALFEELSTKKLYDEFSMEDVSMGGWIEANQLDVLFIHEPRLWPYAGCSEKHISSHKITSSDFRCLATKSKDCTCEILDQNPLANPDMVDAILNAHTLRGSQPIVA